MQNDLKLKYISKNKKGYKLYKLTKPLKFNINDKTYVVPEGFITDLATIPKPLNKFIKRDNVKYDKACILHDYLYESKEVSRYVADELFFIAMDQQRTPLRYSIPFYLTVRLCGWYYY